MCMFCGVSFGEEKLGVVLGVFICSILLTCKKDQILSLAGPSRRTKLPKSWLV